MADQKDKVILEVGIDHSSVRRGLDAVARQSKQFWGNASKGAMNYGKYVHQVANINPIKSLAASHTKVTKMWGDMANKAKEYGSAIKDSMATNAFARSIGKVIKDRQALTKETDNTVMSIHEEAAAVRDAAKAYREKQKEYDNHIKRMRKEQAAMIKAGASKEEIGKVGSRIETVTRAKDLSTQKFNAQYGAVQNKIQGGLFVPKGADSGLADMASTMKGLFKSIEPLVKTFSSLSPLIEGLSGGLMGIVQLLIDAEAQAKEMNKTLIQASGTGGFWAANMQKGGAALLDMKGTLKQVRDDATSLDNMSWGISKDDHMAVLSALGQEGVALTDLSKQFDQAQGHAKSFGGAVQVAVAYSRQFGVSFQEIGQFQGEMMREMGASLDSVEKSFSQMAREAADSGIASNKFFGIIRGVTADLNLYNNRIEDSIKLLGRLGKVMNPREAGKFLGTISQAFRGKSRTDLVKMNLLNGSKGGEYVERDLKRRADQLAEKIGGGVTAEDIRNPNKTTEDLLQNVSNEKKGTFRSALIDLRQDQKMNKKGMFGSSMAMSNMSAGGAAQMLEDSLTRFGSHNKDGSKKKLADVAGEIGPEMMAEQMGISREEMAGRIKFAASMDDQRDELKKNLKDQKVRAKIEKAGIKLTGDNAKDQQALDQAGYDQILDTLDKDAQEEFKKSSEVVDYNKNISDFTRTISDKIKVLVDFVMNQIYNVMMGIWEVVSDLLDAIPGSDKEARALAKMQIAAAKTNNKDVMDAASKATSVGDYKGKLLDSGGWKKIVDQINFTPTDDKGKAQQEALFKTINKSLSNDEIELAAQMAGLGDKFTKAVEVSQADQDKIKQDLIAKDKVRAMGEGATAEQAAKVATDYYNSPDGQKEIIAKTKELQQGREANYRDNLRTNLGDEDYKKILSKAGWAKNQEGMTDFFLNVQKAANQTPTAPAASDTSSEAKEEPTTTAPLTPTQRAQIAQSMPDSTATPKSATVENQMGAAPNANASAPSSSSSPVTKKQGEDLNSAMTDIDNTLRAKGIKMNQSFMKDKFWSAGKDAVLEANREALFEYFMYSKLDPEEVGKALQNGTVSPETFGQSAVDQAMTTGMAPVLDPVKGFASGGMIPQPKSPDSVFVAARPGETILPRGAGSGVNVGDINVNVGNIGPDGKELQDLIKVNVLNGIYEWNRRRSRT